jgi:protocatechuate 4,5-dioxygenase alpha chain
MSRNWIHAMPSPEAYRIDRLLYDLQHDRNEEARYLADPQAYIRAQVGLSAAAAEALARSDIGSLYLLGANPYLLRAYCLQLRVPEEDYLSALRAVAAEASHG